MERIKLAIIWQQPEQEGKEAGSMTGLGRTPYDNPI